MPRCLQRSPSCSSALRSLSPAAPALPRTEGSEQNCCQPDKRRRQRLLPPSTWRKPQGRACTGPNTAPSGLPAWLRSYPALFCRSEILLTPAESLKEIGTSEEKGKSSPVPITTVRLKVCTGHRRRFSILGSTLFWIGTKTDLQGFTNTSNQKGVTTPAAVWIKHVREQHWLAKAC